MKRLCAQAALAFAVSVSAAPAHADNPKPRDGHYWSCNHFLAEGIATHYDKDLNGNPTSSGEIFRNNLLTAASLNTDIVPFSRNSKKPIYVMVTYHSKSIMVRMNDLGAKKGGTKENRIIDLSWAGKVALGAYNHNPVVKTYLCQQTKIPTPMDKPEDMIIATSANPPEVAKQFLAARMTANLNTDFDAPFPGHIAHYEAVLGRKIAPVPAVKSLETMIASGDVQMPNAPAMSADDYNVLVAASLLSPTSGKPPVLAFSQ